MADKCLSIHTSVRQPHLSKAVTATAGTLKGRVRFFFAFQYCFLECKDQVRHIHIYLLQILASSATLEPQNISQNNTKYFKILLLKLQGKQNGNSKGARSERKHQRKQDMSIVMSEFFTTISYITSRTIYTCLNISQNQVLIHLRDKTILTDSVGGLKNVFQGSY